MGLLNGRHSRQVVGDVAAMAVEPSRSWVVITGGTGLLGETMVLGNLMSVSMHVCQPDCHEGVLDMGHT